MSDPRELSNWFHVSFDENGVYFDVRPPGSKGWKDQFLWKNVICVCFKTGDLMTPDEVYIFTDKRPESYRFPMEADGGLEVWNKIIHRKLFGAALAIKVASASTGFYCWP